MLATKTTNATRTLSADEIDAELAAVVYGQRGHELITFFYRRTKSVDAATELLAETFANAVVRRRNDDQLSAHDGEWVRNIAKLELSRYFRKLRVDLGTVDRLGMIIPRLTSSEAEELRDAVVQRPNARLGAMKA